MLLKLVSHNPTGEITKRERYVPITSTTTINHLKTPGGYKHPDIFSNTIIVVEYPNTQTPPVLINDDHEAYLTSELGHTLTVLHRPEGQQNSKKNYDPGVVFYSREIGEGDWYKCSFESYIANSKRPEMDTKYELQK